MSTDRLPRIRLATQDILEIAPRFPRGPPSSGLDGSPPATTEFTGELFRRQQLQELLLGGFPPSRRSGGSAPVSLCVLQLGDESRRFIAREFASSLTLAKPHWTPGVAKVRVSSFLEKAQELSHLGRRSRWTSLLTERHVRHCCPREGEVV